MNEKGRNGGNARNYAPEMKAKMDRIEKKKKEERERHLEYNEKEIEQSKLYQQEIMVKCINCKNDIPQGADTCPYCLNERIKSISKATDGRKVRIRDAYKGDAGRGRIRIDPDVIIEMSLKTGDVIEIGHPMGGKKTAALLYPGKAEDRGTNTIRIDSSLRRNLSASLDDIVEIRKIYASLADKITFAGVELRKPELFVQMLENRVISKGDILSFNTMGRRIDFLVVDFSPKAAAVRIHLDTKISISEKILKEIIKYENLPQCKNCGKKGSDPDQVVCEYCGSELNHN